jgi:hypothetical protein
MLSRLVCARALVALVTRGSFFAAVTLGLSLAGCGSLVGAQQDCSAHPGYLPMWNCIKGRIAQNSAGRMNNAMGVRYVATGDALAERVRAGAITDAQAKMLLAEELARGDREFRANQGVVCMPVGRAVICD